MGDPVEFVKELTGGYGTLSVIDSVGNQNSLAQALGMSQAGGKLSVLGFGHMFEPVDQPYTNSLFRNVTIHTGVVNVAAYMRKLMPMVESGQLDPSVIFTDTLPLADAVEGYDRMMNRNPGTIKVALTN